MAIALPTQTDLHVRDAVLRQLEWDSLVDASGVSATAHDGVIFLSGFINSYAGKLAAERAAKRVRGVRAVANDIKIRLVITRTDRKLAADAARALELRTDLPDVRPVVHGGHVTLTGSVHTLYQRSVAERAIRHLKGLKGIVNRIVVIPRATTAQVQRDIRRAIHRDAELCGRGITAVVNGTVVVLTGSVDSWQARDSAEWAAMHCPGITHVENLISITPRPDEVEDDSEIC